VIQESAGPEGYTNSSTQVNLPLSGSVSGWAARHLTDEMLAEDGIERNSHVTLLYGLTNPDLAKVQEIARAHGEPIRLRLEGFGYFSAPEQDVLFVKVKSADMHKLHKHLRRLPNIYRFPNYKPHMTIAYLKKGYVEKFLDMDCPFDGEHHLPGFWLNYSKNQGNVFMPTVGVSFERRPMNTDLHEALEILCESVGRRRPKRQMRLVYLPQERRGVPPASGPVEELIDELIADVHQIFDWSAIYSGDRQQARIAASDLFNDVMNLARLKIADEANKENGLKFTLEDVRARWSKLLRFSQRSSELAMRSIRRRIRV